MGIPNYAYMMLKIPGPQDVITIHGAVKQAVKCDSQSFNLAAYPPSQDCDNISGSWGSSTRFL